jgi:hypothetical protein
MAEALRGKHHKDENTGTGFMNSSTRGALRHVFELRIVIRFRRKSRNRAVQAWARNLSESGLGAFVADDLVVGERVTLQIPLGSSGKEVIHARVAHRLGTQYGFQFTAVSAEQRVSIQVALKDQQQFDTGK